MVKRKRLYALLTVVLAALLLTECRSTEDPPPTPPTEPTETPPAPSATPSDTPDPIRLDFLPASTWLVMATPNPSVLSEQLGWKTFLEQFPMLSPRSPRHINAIDLLPGLLDPSFLEKHGLDPEAPAGFAIAGLSRPEFLVFASIENNKDSEIPSLRSQIEKAFPATKTSSRGSHTILEVNDAALPQCPCTVVLSQKHAVALSHPDADVRTEWIEIITGEKPDKRFINRDDITPLHKTLERAPGITAFLDLAPIIDLQVQQLLLSIDATYDHAVNSLEKVRREGGEPDVIAHWENQVKIEEDWLAENKARRKAEAAFFQRVYGSISSVTLGIDFGNNDIRFDAHVLLQPNSLMGTLFNNEAMANPTPWKELGGSIVALAGQINWKSFFEIVTLGYAADRTASQPVWAPDPGMYAWLDALTNHPFEAVLSHTKRAEDILKKPQGLYVDAHWGPLDARAIAAAMALSGDFSGASGPSKNGKIRAEIGDLQADVFEENGRLRLRLQTPGTYLEPNTQFDALPADLQGLFSKENPALRFLAKAEILSWFLAVEPVERAPSSEQETGSKAFLAELAKKEEELSVLENKQQEIELAEVHVQLNAWGWTALHLQITSNGWQLQGGQFLTEGTVQEQFPRLLEALVAPRKKRPIDKQIRTLRREIRILRLRGDQPEGSSEEIQNLPTLPASP